MTTTPDVQPLAPRGEPARVGDAPRPARVALPGRYIDVVPLDPEPHGEVLFETTAGPQHDGLWTYLFDGPFHERGPFDAWLERKAATDDPLAYAIVDKRTGDAAGCASLMRVDPPNRVVEVGSILFVPALQRTRGATEAMYLMARYVFDELGYRRYEWKCDALNAPSRAAAVRLGFTFEGVFRQHMVVKGRNRDTAWYSMLDCEWPDRRKRFERWLNPANFDAEGVQKTTLAGVLPQP